MPDKELQLVVKKYMHFGASAYKWATKGGKTVSGDMIHCVVMMLI